MSEKTPEFYRALGEEDKAEKKPDSFEFEGPIAVSPEDLAKIIEFEQLKKYIPQVEEYIKKYRLVFNDVARDSSLQYQPSLKGFFIDLEKGVINLDAKDWQQAEELGLDKEQILWSVLHEIGHFEDLRNDPEGMMDNFKYMRARSQELSAKVLEVWGKKFPDGKLPDYVTRPIPIPATKTKPASTITFAEAFIYEKLHNLYNSLDDIYVNNGIGLNVSKFAPNGSSISEVSRLYRDYLFPTDSKNAGQPPKEGEPADYKEHPRFLQFAYYFLRHHMVPDQEVLVSDEVQEVINRKVGLVKKESLGDKVESICRRAGKYEKLQNIAKVRHDAIKAYIEPAFVELFLKDCEEMDLPPEPEKQKGKGENGGEPQEGEPQENESQGDEKQKDESQKSEGQEGKEGEEPKDDKEEKGKGKSRKGEKEQKDEEKTKDEGEGEEGEKSEEEGEESEGRPSEQKEGEEGKEGKKSWDNPFKNYKPSPFSPEDVEKFAKEQKEKSEKKGEEKEEEERAKRLDPDKINKMDKEDIDKLDKLKKRNPNALNQGQKEALAKRKQDLDFCEKNNIEPEVLESYEAIKKSVEQYIKDISAVFEELMMNVSQQISTAWQEGFRSGKVNIKSLIERYGHYFQEGAIDLIPFDELSIYDQKEFISRLKMFPEKINARLVIDGSGSMMGEKILAAQQLAVALLESFEHAKWAINEHFHLKKPIIIDTQIIMFGSGCEEVKQFMGEESYDSKKERLAKLKGFSKMTPAYGGTSPHTAWGKIDRSLSDQKYIEDLKAGKIKEFAFEITDGGAQNEGDARLAVDEVEQKGVITRAFQIGNPDQGDKEIFDRIWGEDGERIPDPSKLAPALLKMLAEELKKIRIKVEFVDED